jgi:acyl-ACP thioesterase
MLALRAVSMGLEAQDVFWVLLTPRSTVFRPQEFSSLSQHLLGAAIRFKWSEAQLQLLGEFGNHYCLGLWIRVSPGCREAHVDLGDKLFYGVVAGASIDKDLVGFCEEFRAWLI